MFVIKHLSLRGNLASERMRPVALLDLKFGCVLRAILAMLSIIFTPTKLFAFPLTQAQVNNPRRRRRTGCGILNVAFVGAL